jgi:hypothetical protein
VIAALGYGEWMLILATITLIPSHPVLCHIYHLVSSQFTYVIPGGPPPYMSSYPKPSLYYSHLIPSYPIAYHLISSRIAVFSLFSLPLSLSLSHTLSLSILSLSVSFSICMSLFNTHSLFVCLPFHLVQMHPHLDSITIFLSGSNSLKSIHFLPSYCSFFIAMLLALYVIFSFFVSFCISSHAMILWFYVYLFLGFIFFFTAKFIYCAHQAADFEQSKTVQK